MCGHGVDNPNDCPKTPRGRWKRPLECCLLGWFYRYFFFAAFFAAFLAGAFLAAFLVAICLFSLFRWVASNLQYQYCS
jgi:hypothetical protein